MPLTINSGTTNPTATCPEILFIDPSVSDVETIVDSLRPQVEAVVLDESVPAAKQIAAFLANRSALHAVHIIAHGAPGRVCFASGDWSSETLESAGEELATIGRALCADGDIRLWSCNAGAQPEGVTFVAGLGRTAGAPVRAAAGRVGAAALGGSWDLGELPSGAAIQPPLTLAGVSRYAMVFPVTVISKGDEPVYVYGAWPNGAKSGLYFVVWNRDGALEKLHQFIVPEGMGGTFAAALHLPPGTYNLGVAGVSDSIGVYAGIHSGSEPLEKWAIGMPDQDLTSRMTLGESPRHAYAI